MPNSDEKGFDEVFNPFENWSAFFEIFPKDSLFVDGFLKLFVFVELSNMSRCVEIFPNSPKFVDHFSNPTKFCSFEWETNSEFAKLSKYDTLSEVFCRTFG